MPQGLTTWIFIFSNQRKLLIKSYKLKGSQMEQCLCRLAASIGVFPVFLILFTVYHSGKEIWNNREQLGSAALKVFCMPEVTYQAVKSHTAIS